MNISRAIIILAAIAAMAGTRSTVLYASKLSGPDQAKDYAQFRELPIGSVMPSGWVKGYLRNQRDGLSSHISAAGFPFNTDGWYGDQLTKLTNSHWGSFEQTAFWLEGAVRCGHLLRDKRLLALATKQFDYVLDHADSDGYLGPGFLKTGFKDYEAMRWPHTPFLTALMSQYSATRDKRILDAVRKHYLSETDPMNRSRAICNIEVMAWVYRETGDRRLIDLAEQAYREWNADPNNGYCATMDNMISDRPLTGLHGCVVNETARQAAVLYSCTGKKRYLDAVINAYRKMDRDNLLIDGVPSSSEGLQGKTALDCHETCAIADYTWALGFLLMTTGNADYADRIERACFNAAPGAVAKRFTALEYFSAPNQVICDKHSCYVPPIPAPFWETPFMSYRPNPGTECCAGSVSKIMPNFASRMWMSGRNGGIAAALFGPSIVTFRAGSTGIPVTISEDTSYPFSERIDFRIGCAEDAEFPLAIRIPGWANKPWITVNGEPISDSCKPGTFVTLNRRFHGGDVVRLFVPMKLKVTEWPGGAIAIERGPLVYSLGVKGDWQVDRDDKRSTPDFPAWNLYPAGDWNYALAIDPKAVDAQVKIVKRKPTNNPWTLENAPIELKVPARRVTGWTLVSPEPSKPDVRFTPPLPDIDKLPGMLGTDMETITLVPYGCTNLRITLFPKATRVAQ